MLCPILTLLDNAFTQVVGFPAGNYPDANLTYQASHPFTGNQVFLSSQAASISPSYVPVHYKPSNPQFAVQGAVDGGTLVDRKKYNTITTAAATLEPAWGSQTADALAYGVNPTGVNITAKLLHGMPIQRTPKFNPRTGAMSKCQVRHLPGG